MTLPSPTRAQLEPVIEHLLAKAGGETAPLVLIRADPADLPDIDVVAGRKVTVRGTASPLEIRALTLEPRDQPLVVITPCDHEQLGRDLLARVFKGKAHELNRWETVSRLFGAERPSRELARHDHLAEALLAARPVEGYPKIATKQLDLDTALDALVRSYLGVGDDIVGLDQLLAWAETPAAASLVRNARAEVLTDLQRFLAVRFGPGADAALAVVAAGRGDEIMPLALAAGVVHDPAVAREGAIVLLDVALDRPRLDPEAYRSLAAAAVDRLRTGAVDPAAVSTWLAKADRLLAEDFGIGDEAWRSDWLPSGFDQRIAAAARQLDAWRQAPGDDPRADAAAQAIAAVARHHRAGRESDRRERLAMAARLIRRGTTPMDVGTLGQLAQRYVADGAWLDRARFSVSRGDPEPTLAALCRALTDQFDEARRAQGAELARVATAAAHDIGEHLIAIEDVLDRIVAPVEERRPVLLVVLDGMGWPTFTEVAGRLAESGWAVQADPEGRLLRRVVAALPTVTEVSRTSLLAGRLRRGDQASERRAFAEHPALLARSKPGHPPTLWHKPQLREGGLDTVPGMLSTIADESTRVVGVVLNNIDERLKDVIQPPAGWGLDELAPLRELLDAARAAGRIVVLTADHGHVLDRDAEARPGGGGGERWRRAGGEAPGDGEILVEGPRVVTDDHRAILPWAEQLRYAPRRNGYHGGITPAELIVPLAVLAAEDVDGWDATTITPPAWWHHTPAPVVGSPVSPPRRPTSPPPKRAVPDTPTLFDVAPTEPAQTESAPPDEGDWVNQILTAPAIAEKLPRLRLNPQIVGRMLVALAANGGTWTAERRIADAAGVPVNRISRYITQVQQLVNLDGYGVVETSGGEVRFDRALLERQLELSS